jgi:hypothetical protein
MNKQKGLTLTGMLIVSILLVLVLLLGFKILPVYLEYNTIQKHFVAMASDPALRGATRGDLTRSWYARTTIDDVKSLTPESIEYEKSASGWTIRADYSVKVPLFKNVSAYFDLHPTSAQ